MTLDRLGAFELAAKERRERKGRRDQEVHHSGFQISSLSLCSLRSLAAKKMTLDRLGDFELAAKERRKRKGRQDQGVHHSGFQISSSSLCFLRSLAAKK